MLKKILEDPSILSKESVKKEMTVLFSDIREFTTLSENIPAQEFLPQLNEYFEAVVDIILGYNGTIDKYMGDAIMVFYGDPLPMEDHAKRAVMTAFDILDALNMLNVKWKSENKPTLNIGIGINTGEMNVCPIGSKKILNYTVMGDNVNLASRLEGLNKNFNTNVIIGESTYEAVKDIVNATYHGENAIKGKNQSVKVYSISRL